MNKAQRFLKQPLTLLQIAGWTGYAITDHVGHLMYGGGHILSSIASGYLAMLLTTFIAIIANKLKYRPMAWQILIGLTLLFIASVIWIRLFSVFHGHVTLEQITEYSLPQWLSGVSGTMFLFVGWAGLYMGSKIFIVNRQQQLELQKALVAAKQAQLQTLRYQLNPHFLFNVLNSIDVSLLAKKTDVCHSMLKHLSSFLRNSLQNGDKDKISLEQELNILNEFVAIEQVRFADKLAVRMAVNSDCHQALLPPMLLQPLMENAIKFAWSQTQPGEVNLAATKQHNTLRIEMVNTVVEKRSGAHEQGISMDEYSGEGVGLSNTRERLLVTYGDDASIITEETEFQYKVILTLPWINKF